MNTESKVCGKLITVTRASNEKGEKFTLLNYCADVPNACFTGRIPDNSNLKFPVDLKTFANKNVCITGLIHYWEDKPEIIIKEVGQIEKQ